jgi:hypothetical protein
VAGPSSEGFEEKGARKKRSDMEGGRCLQQGMGGILGSNFCGRVKRLKATASDEEVRAEAEISGAASEVEEEWQAADEAAKCVSLDGALAPSSLRKDRFERKLVNESERTSLPAILPAAARGRPVVDGDGRYLHVHHCPSMQ